MLRKFFFDLQYRFSKPPWDSNVTPPEVVTFVEHTERRGRALDLGCGTGTNSMYLAQHGYHVVGVDFSAKAIATAREKSKRAGLGIAFHVADVTRLDMLDPRAPPFDFILDIGCLHAIDDAGRARYAEHLAQLTHPGSVFMLYAFSPRPENERGHWLKFRNVGITPEQTRQLLTPHFALERIEHGNDRAERTSAWYWFVRTAS
jgi:SAM-dependent methyltransferase